MHLLMSDLLREYDSLNNLLKKNYGLIERKWKYVLKENNIYYVNAYIYETGINPRDLELEFMLQTSECLTSDEKNIIERKACCKLSNCEELCSIKGNTYFYTFSPFKIIHNPLNDSWLKD